MNTHTITVLREVAAERARQDAKWGEQNHPLGFGTFTDRESPTYLAMVEAKEMCNTAAKNGTLNFRLIIDEEHKELFATETLEEAREEAVQCAAVNVAIVERIDRIKGNCPAPIDLARFKAIDPITADDGVLCRAYGDLLALVAELVGE